jgi:hypothetical protein
MSRPICIETIAAAATTTTTTTSAMQIEVAKIASRWGFDNWSK